MNSLERSNSIEAQPIKKHTAESKSINPLEQRTNTSIALVNDVYKQKQGVDIPEDIKYLLYKTLKSTEESQRDGILDDIINFISEDDNPNLQIEAYLNGTIKTDTDILADNSQQSNEQKESDRQRHALQLAESLSSLKGEGKEYSGVLQRIVALKDVVATEGLTEKLDNEIASILQALESPQTLLAISLDLQEQDRKHGTHTYDAFKSSVIAMAPSFREKFSKADSRAMIALGTDTLKNTSRSDSKITQSTDDGFKLEATLNCTKRAISYKGSEYALSSDIGAKSALEESESIERKLQENLKPLNESLKRSKALRSRLDATSTKDKTFYELKSDLRSEAPELYTKLGLESAQSLDDIHRILRLHEVRLLEQIDELEQNAAGAKADLISDLKARAAEKDAIRKTTLQVFAEMGFDMFPQQETDAVFEWLNNNQAVREGLGANALFDIENGILGYKGAFTGSNTIPIQGEIVFAKVFNKMLTGCMEFPVGFDDFGNCVFYQSVEDAEAKRIDTNFDMKFFGNQRLGSGDRVGVMIENLKGEDIYK